MSTPDQSCPADIYLHLPREEKRKFEQRVLRNPYHLNTQEMRTLYNAGFPFIDRGLKWIGYYLELTDFYNIHHHCRVSTSPLSTWVRNQRNKRFYGRHALDRERALSRLKFVWDIEAAQWQAQYHDFKFHVENHGEIRCPKRLCGWACRMRRKWDQLPQYRKRLLEKLHFDINPIQTIWTRNLEDLELTYAIEGNLIALNSRLERFVRRMRKLHRAGRLTFEQQSRLERAGVTWKNPRPSRLKPPYTSIWDMHYDEAKTFVQQPVKLPPIYKWPNKNLSMWVRSQWREWNSLSAIKKARLALLDLEPIDAQRAFWDARYEEARKLYKQLGKFHVPTYRLANKTIARWIRLQLEIWKTLQPDQKEKVLALGIALPPGEAHQLNWENAFQRAKRYAELGPTFVLWRPRKLIREWIGRQVERKDKLNVEQLQKLAYVTSRLTPDYFFIERKPHANEPEQNAAH